MAGEDANGGRRGARLRLALWGAAAALVVAAAAMQATGRMAWGAGDFLLAGGLIVSLGIAIELALRASDKLAYRAAAGVGLAAGVLLAWGNLALGVIGSEDNPANLMFWGVLAVALAGGLIARFRAAGMVWAMLATAVAQVAAALIAVAMGLGSSGPLTGAFAALWLLSAVLFWSAARQAPSGA